jgi:hypothetical protein
MRSRGGIGYMLERWTENTRSYELNIILAKRTTSNHGREDDSPASRCPRASKRRHVRGSFNEYYRRAYV